MKKEKYNKKNELMKVFEKEEFGKIRIIVKEQELWFALTDICKVLEIGNPSDVAHRLNPKGVVKIEVSENTSLERGERNVHS